MIREELTYEGIEGPITEEYYFSLTAAELMEQMVEASGIDGLGDDLQGRLKAIVATKDPKVILPAFKKIVLSSVGKREGNKFIKTDKIREEFAGCGAYSELFFRMITDAGYASKFVNGIVPKNVEEKLAEVNKGDVLQLPESEPEDNRPAWLKENREPTEAELHKMSPEELKLAFRHRMAQR